MYTLHLSDYIITRDGEVINKKSGRRVKPQKNGKGYLRVSIAGKLEFVHRLVAAQYVPNPENKPQVNHKDGNKLNNSAENLEWVTNFENRSHASKNGLHLRGESCPYSKLTEENVRYIRSHPEMRTIDFARMFNVSRGAVICARYYRTWKHLK